MANNDSEIDEKKMLKSIINFQELFEKALKCDNEKLRKEIEVILKVLDKFQENYKKRAYRKIAKKSGMTIEMLIAGISTFSIMFRTALDDFDDKDLRKFTELYVEQAKISREFFFGE